MNKLIKKLILLAFSLCLIFSTQAFSVIYAYNVTATPETSTNGSFDVTWSVVNNNSQSWCAWFEVTVTKQGTSGVYDYEETINCNQKSFSATGYPAGEYMIVITTTYEYYYNNNIYLASESEMPIYVTVNSSTSSTAVNFSYQYDALGRLVTVIDDTKETNYDYDDADNRTSKTVQ